MFRSAINSFMSLCAITILFLLGTAGIVRAENNIIDRYVIAISANNGGKNRPLLRYAESDAKAFASVLRDMGGVQPRNMVLIREPSVESLNARLAELDKQIASRKGMIARDEVLVYYSGHADEKGLRLGNELYAWSELRKRIDSLGADIKIAVIDACGSGAITRTKGGVAVPAFMMDRSSDMKGYAFITSSTQDESSQESDKLKGSFFTHSLVSGLRGAGDVSGDGKVTLSEAYQFAFNETLQKTQSTMGGAQHPSRDMNLAGTGDVVITDLRSMGAGVSFDKNLEGRLFIRDDKGALVAELYKSSGRQMSLGLPAGKYEIYLEKASAHKTTTLALANGKIENVALAHFSDVTIENTVSRGEIKSEKSCIAGDSIMCSLDSLDRNGKTRITFNAVDSDKDPRKGMQIGFFVTKADDYMLGSQISLIANVAKKEMHGLQVTNIYNGANEHFEGAQVSALANYAGSIKGAQISSTINLAGGESSGAQVAGCMNIAKKLNGAQVSPALNIANQADVQVTAMMNIASITDGPQVGVLNIAGTAKGRQWGVINICGDCQKTPIGLLNFVGNGVWSATASVNEMGSLGISLHLGTAYFYSVLEGSREFEKGSGFKHFNKQYESGVGFGTQFGKYGNHIELEYMFLNTHYDSFDFDFGQTNDFTNYHHRIRMGLVHRLFPGFGMVVGGTLNLVTQGEAGKVFIKPMSSYHVDLGHGEHKARFWPGFYAGLTLGRF